MPSRKIRFYTKGPTSSPKLLDEQSDLDASFCFSESDKQPHSINLDLCNDSPLDANCFIAAHWNINSILTDMVGAVLYVYLKISPLNNNFIFSQSFLKIFLLMSELTTKSIQLIAITVHQILTTTSVF